MHVQAYTYVCFTFVNYGVCVCVCVCVYVYTYLQVDIGTVFDFWHHADINIPISTLQQALGDGEPPP